MTRRGWLAAISLILLVAAFVVALLLERSGAEVASGPAGDGGGDGSI